MEPALPGHQREAGIFFRRTTIQVDPRWLVRALRPGGLGGARGRLIGKNMTGSPVARDSRAGRERTGVVTPPRPLAGRRFVNRRPNGGRGHSEMLGESRSAVPVRPLKGKAWRLRTTPAHRHPGRILWCGPSRCISPAKAGWPNPIVLGATVRNAGRRTAPSRRGGVVFACGKEPGRHFPVSRDMEIEAV